MIAWTSWLIRKGETGGGSPPARRRGLCSESLLPRRLRIDDLVRGRRVLGEHDLLVAALPLGEQEGLLRSPCLVPREGPEDRVHGVVSEPVGERLLVVDRADRFDGGLQYLGGRVGVRGVLGGIGVELR